MILYKFRPLATCQDLARAQQILETGEFWCSRFWELNDPMEGVYWFSAGTLGDDVIGKLYDEKSKCAICSFSGEKAFKNPIVWGYYANGFRGIAIKIEYDEGSVDIEKVNYASEIASMANGEPTGDAVKRILTTKLCCWEHEDEYRYVNNGDHSSRKIGDVTAVYFGAPYKTAVNAEVVRRRPCVREYLCRVESLQKTADDKGIQWGRVEVVDGQVRIDQSDEGACRQT